MERAVGTITVIQEGRFRLACDSGRSLHFTLDRHASIEPQDLPGLRGARVAVLYGGKTGMSGSVAHAVRRVDA